MLAFGEAGGGVGSLPFQVEAAALPGEPGLDSQQTADAAATGTRSSYAVKPIDGGPHAVRLGSQVKDLVDEPQHGAKEQGLPDTLNAAERSVGKVASPPLTLGSLSGRPWGVVPRSSTLRQWTELAHAAREYITEHSARSTLSLADVAEAHNVSRRTLQRALASDATDYSRELRIARMDQSARFLSRTGGSVAAAWERSGYRSHAHFTRTFERFFGISPQRYRRIATLEERLAWRDWKDRVSPVLPGSSEYFRRRKRRSENVRELQRLTRGLLPNARSALTIYAPRQRPVVDLNATHRARKARRRRHSERVLEDRVNAR